MSNVITQEKLITYLDELDTTLKDQIVATALTDDEGREKFYLMYHATQLLRARVLSDFQIEYKPSSSMYDEGR